MTQNQPGAITTLAHRKISPQEALRRRRDAFAYSQTLRGKASSRIQKLFQVCAYCVTSGGMGVFAGHAGCVVTPIVTALAPLGDTLLRLSPFSPLSTLGIGLAGDAALVLAWHWGRKHELKLWQRNITAAFAAAALSVTAVTGAAMLISAANYQPAMTLAIGSSITGAALGGWYALRGRFVSKPLRWGTIGIAAASLVITTLIKTPHMYDMWQTYQSYASQDPEGRDGVIKLAKSLGYSGLDDFLNQCSSNRNNFSDWQKIKASYLPGG